MIELNKTQRIENNYFHPFSIAYNNIRFKPNTVFFDWIKIIT